MIAIVQCFTLVMMIGVLIVGTFNLIAARMTYRHTRRTATLIEQYRREIGWLTARVEALENKNSAEG